MKYLLIGNPNAGKTSIYNKLTASENIIHRAEGTTRDWHESLIKGLKYSTIYDSPGVNIRFNKSSNIHFSNLLKEIDIYLYVIDVKSKNYDFNNESINELRKFNKKIILLINKDDNFKQNSIYSKSGFENLFYISCSHNLGFEQLYEYLEKNDHGTTNIYKTDYSIAVYGKPNAGKSTLVNSFLGYDRILTSNIAGTTSDAVENTYKYKNINFKIIDTAGIFKKQN